MDKKAVEEVRIFKKEAGGQVAIWVNPTNIGGDSSLVWNNASKRLDAYALNASNGTVNAGLYIGTLSGNYALALASRTKLAVKDFKCAWFDEKSYYEFFPLHAVYGK